MNALILVMFILVLLELTQLFPQSVNVNLFYNFADMLNLD
jgi:hypothetical protein